MNRFSSGCDQSQKPVGSALALAAGLAVVGQGLDVVGYGRLASGIDEVEPHDGLMAAAGDPLQQPFHRRPVVGPPLLHHVIVFHVAVFELDRVGPVVLRRRPEDDPGHRLDVGDPALQRDGVERVFRVSGRRVVQDEHER